MRQQGVGVVRECVVCKKLFMVGNPKEWVYRRNGYI